MNEDDAKRLEDIIKQMSARWKKIPLNLVIKVLSGYEILPFDPNDSKDVSVLNHLIAALNLAGQRINSKGILRTRANEVGNDIEPFVKESLRSEGYKADAPKTKGGNKKSAGYPDIEFFDEFGRTNYLECKTFNVENISTTQRSFYLSPSEDFKITQDAHHFLATFEIESVETRGNKNLYQCRSWKIRSLDTLSVDVKYEFNSDNARLYTKDLILAEGKV